MEDSAAYARSLRFPRTTGQIHLPKRSLQPCLRGNSTAPKSDLAQVSSHTDKSVFRPTSRLWLACAFCERSRKRRPFEYPCVARGRRELQVRPIAFACQPGCDIPKSVRFAHQCRASSECTNKSSCRSNVETADVRSARQYEVKICFLIGYCLPHVHVCKCSSRFRFRGHP